MSPAGCGRPPVLSSSRRRPTRRRAPSCCRAPTVNDASSTAFRRPAPTAEDATPHGEPHAEALHLEKRRRGTSRHRSCRRPLLAHVAYAVSAGFTQHATVCRGATGSRGGSISAHSWIAQAHLSRNGQPVISTDRSGGAPSIAASSRRRRPSRGGIERNNPIVYGCRGAPSTCLVGPVPRSDPRT